MTSTDSVGKSPIPLLNTVATPLWSDEPARTAPGEILRATRRYTYDPHPPTSPAPTQRPAVLQAVVRAGDVPIFRAVRYLGEHGEAQPLRHSTRRRADAAPARLIRSRTKPRRRGSGTQQHLRCGSGTRGRLAHGR